MRTSPIRLAPLPARGGSILAPWELCSITIDTTGDRHGNMERRAVQVDREALGELEKADGCISATAAILPTLEE